MVREDIFAGLKSAVERGESLKQAMISFFNAGYSRGEIQEAAKALQEEQLTKGIAQSSPPAESPKNQEAKIQPLKKGKTKQVVSKYTPKKKTGMGVIIVLGIILAVLIGSLVAIFIFREQLTDILNKLI